MNGTKLEQAARKALEALEYGIPSNGTFSVSESMELDAKAITALREALAEPQIKSDNYLNGYCTGRTDLLAEQAKQEPVGYVQYFGDKLCFRDKPKKNWYPVFLNAAPVQQVDLTDDELHQIWRDIKSLVGLYSFQEIACAVIAAYKEKNK